MKLSLRSTTKHLILKNKAIGMFDLLGCSANKMINNNKKNQTDPELKRRNYQ